MIGRRHIRKYAFCLLIIEAVQVVYPNVAMALTTGPAQPEMQQFTPIGASDMVDLFTGDFSYNIPLLDVEGYPINIGYQAGISNDQEATWVGLGWNINPGIVNRDLRGIPDDFNGDVVTQKKNLRNNWTVGVEIGLDKELTGWDFLGPNGYFTGSLYYNNYRGPGYTAGLGLLKSVAGPLTGGLNASVGNQDGLSITPSLGLGNWKGDKFTGYGELGAQINSRGGLKSIFLGSKWLSQQKQLQFLSGSQLGNAVYSFNKPSFYPSADFPISNYAFTLTAKGGTEFWTAFPNGSLSGYYYQESLVEKNKEVPGYGVLYIQNADSNPKALQDFAREKDIAVRESSVNIAIPYTTFDVFNVSGQGLSGSYHATRNDLGVFHDSYNQVGGINADAGVDGGAGPGGVHLGIEVSGIFPKTTTGAWKTDNEFDDYSYFTSTTGNDVYEPVYFKNGGEFIVDKGEMFGDLGRFKRVNVSVIRDGSNAVAQKQILVRDLFSGEGHLETIASNIQNHDRLARQQLFSYLTAKEAENYAISKKILNYPLNDNPYKGCFVPGSSKVDSLDRRQYPDHHISEVTVTQTDGKRYIYGIPAYNIVQKEATFAVDADDVDAETMKVNYDEGIDDSEENSQGKDHFYDYQEIPPYAHSFLLTEILSSDYVDNTGNGVTPDDKGQSYKLNYSKLDDIFKWRAPLDSASYQEGMKSSDRDDKGSYVYGEKEVWYLHSVESRNMIAQFILSDRNDGLGVIGVDGGVDAANKLKKLDRIDLFSKADLLQYGDKAVPIKSVHFVYDYSLCKGVTNQVNTSEGKLTLQAIYFTFGNNTKGIINQYQFDYDETNPDANPNYNGLNYDRWGGYKDQNEAASYFPNPSDVPNGVDFPYSIQDKTLADQFASVWCLRHINLPSGGTINIEYESDDYAFVQNKRAAQMVFVKGFGDDSSYTDVDDRLYEVFDNREYMYLELPKYVHSAEEFQNLYLDGLDLLYYKFQVCLGNLLKDPDTYEYVQGYCKWLKSGVYYEDPGDDSTNIAWLKIDMVEEENIGSAHPISVNAWQSLRLNLPEVAYPGSDINATGAEDAIAAVFTVIPSLVNLIFGFNNAARADSKGQWVDLDKSWVRLNNPTFQKFGGGLRVKKVTISDNWNEMVSTQESYEYGQEYTYTTFDDDYGKVISSGVASYEPMNGGDENPLKQPVFYEEKALLAPDNTYYSELPLGESLYPMPIVGYSEVRVNNIEREHVTRTATGYSISQFYTAKEFPIISVYTDLEPIRVKPNPILKFLQVGVKDYLTCSQGFYIELNDMHGKPSMENVYDETGFLISSKKYDYKVDDPDADELHLNNQCSVIYPDGSVETETIGVDFEASQDMREQESTIIGGGLELNLDLVLNIPPIPPVLVPGLYPTFTSSKTRFRSSATTKFIKRYGILDKITVTDKGSTITTENVLYDSETGQVLLSKVNNEFEDPIYQFNYPAHWIYKNMGPAYINIGAQFKNVTVVNGVISGLTDPEAYFIEGDEIAVEFEGMSMGEKLHVIKPYGNVRLINSEGQLYTKYDPTGTFAQPLNLKILRSGNRNQSAYSAGTITTLEYPVNGVTKQLDLDESKKIINASSTVYSELWPTECTEVVLQCDTDVVGEQCLAQFLLALIDDPDYTQYLYATESDSIGLDTIFSPWCDFEDDAFYTLSDVNSTGLYRNLEDTDAISTTLLALCDFDGMVGDCNVHFNNFLGCIPLSLPDIYELSYPGGSYPEDAVLITYVGPDALWLGDTLLNGTDVGYFYSECITCEEVCVEFAPGDTVNPYMLNMLGVWRPVRTYAFNDQRTPSSGTTATNVRVDGYYDNFDEFYSFNEGSGVWDIDSTDENWIWTTEAIAFDKHGNEVESKNALNIYSSALYGYNKSLATAVANNASLNQIANENFEDYGFNKRCNDQFCITKHWSYEDSLNSPESTVSELYGHSGNRSLRLTEGDSISLEKNIETVTGSRLIADELSSLYTLDDNPCITDFSPSPGDYLFGAWVLIDTTCHCTNYEEEFVEITFPGAPGTSYSFFPAGQVIEGWQRIEGKFSVPVGATGIIVKLRADDTNITYYDDIRIHPYKGNMKTFVYDRKSMRLMAELDENNYATFYEYDDEGILVRVKRETERGVVTIQEGRSKLKSNL